jgi:hypothetical protein
MNHKPASGCDRFQDGPASRYYQRRQDVTSVVKINECQDVTGSKRPVLRYDQRRDMNQCQDVTDFNGPASREQGRDTTVETAVSI